jgi:hypothetical protein
MSVESIGHGFQLATDLVFGGRLKYTGLDGAFFAHGQLLVFWFVFFSRGCYKRLIKLPGAFTDLRRLFSQIFNKLAFLDGH